MTKSKQYSNEEGIYSDENRKLIIALLTEYSLKLLDVCDRIDRSRDFFRGFVLLHFLLLFLLITWLLYNINQYVNIVVLTIGLMVIYLALKIFLFVPSNVIEFNRKKLAINTLISTIFLIVPGMRILLCLPISEYLNYTLSKIFEVNLLGIFVSIHVSLIIIAIQVFSSGIWQESKQKRILLTKDAMTLSTKLEKVVRFASQIYEHASFRNVESQLELDLRLADAESALQHYEANKKNNTMF